MATIGTTELVIILMMVILLFGVGRISRIGEELGSLGRKFRQGLRGDKHPKDEK